jgi:hypothetical protein
MKKELFLILLLIIIPSISAIRINEVELNPLDDCKDCTEWAEIYSDTEINLSEYYLENNKSKIINLSGVGQGYIKIGFGKQFLTNSGDRLILKKLTEIIDETPVIIDEDNNNKTWQFCDNWKFKEETKGKENDCNEQEQTNQEDNTSNYEENITEDEEEEQTKNIIKMVNNNTTTQNTTITTQTIENPVINLGSKNINTAENSSNQEKDKNLYVLYGLIAFCIFLAVLFELKFLKNKREEIKEYGKE